MPDKDDTKAGNSAESAYAAAASVIPAAGKAEPSANKAPAPKSTAKVADAKPVEKPAAKEVVAAKPVAKPPVAAKVEAPVAATPAKPVVEPKAAPAALVKTAKPVPAKVQPAKAAIAKSSPKAEPLKVPAMLAASAKKAIEVSPVAKAAAPKAAEPKVLPPKSLPAEPALTKIAAPKITDEPIAAPKTAPAAEPLPRFTKDTFMDMTANIAGLQNVLTEAQAKAKAAFEKSTSMMGEYTEFAKGNVEAMIESGKILADGVQGMGSTMVAEGRSSFEAMSGDMKELAAAKSPTDFFKLQSDLVRKNFDSAVAHSSKNSEAMLKLMSDVFAPISGRVSMAVEKVRQTAV